MIEELLQLIFNGVVTGSVIAIASVGATLVWGVLKIGNFAHGDFLAVGAFAAFSANTLLGLNIFISTVFAVIFTAGFAYVVDKTLLKPTRGRGPTTIFMVTVGLGFVIRNVLFLIFGSGASALTLDQAFVMEIGPIRASLGQVIAISMTTTSILALGWMLATTTLGRSMRAMSENPDLAAVTGVNTDRLATITWIITGSLAGLAGVGVAMVQGTFDANLGEFLLLLIFTAAVLGGIGSAYGALLGGFALGLTMEVATWSGFSGGLDPRYKFVLAFGALIMLLVVRPQGIFGKSRLV